MADIIQRFCVKAKIDKNNIYCVCNGNTLDENITLEKIMNLKNNNDKINILVFHKNAEELEEINPINNSSTKISF